MEVILICVFAVAAASVCTVACRSSVEFRLLISAAACAMILLKVSDELGGIISQIRSLFDESSLDHSYVMILIKGLGICYVTNFAVSVCRDCGESAIASQTLLAGRIALVVISLPMIEDLIEIVKMLLL